MSDDQNIKNKSDANTKSNTAIIIYPRDAELGNAQDDAYRLSEAESLFENLGVEIISKQVAPLKKHTPATLIGGGKCEDIKSLVEEENVAVVFVDAHLNGIQQKNLEKLWNCKVIDRTGVILEIFGMRARTLEGRLQVDLATLSYEKTRLVRRWTHLERQRGGLGKVGGPGESQLEIDRRLLDEKINRIKRKLEHVKKVRAQQKKNRKRSPTPHVALVGYTNAGKSTLFNVLANEAIYAKDQLFATLDPTMRKIHLPSNEEAFLSDTVGFITDLPHELVAAFKATLEEVIEADIIVHVADRSADTFEGQQRAVLSVLKALGIDTNSKKILHVWNKADLLESEEFERFSTIIDRTDDVVLTSTKTGYGLEDLRTCLRNLIHSTKKVVEFHLPYTQAWLVEWLRHEASLIECFFQDDVIYVKAALTPKQESYVYLNVRP